MNGANSFANGILTRIGEGSINYGPEANFETYYKFVPWKGMEITGDYQFVQNPNFLKNSNTAHVFGIRLRASF